MVATNVQNIVRYSFRAAGRVRWCYCQGGHGRHEADGHHWQMAKNYYSRHRSDAWQPLCYSPTDLFTYFNSFCAVLINIFRYVNFIEKPRAARSVERLFALPFISGQLSEAGMRRRGWSIREQRRSQTWPSADRSAYHSPRDCQSPCNKSRSNTFCHRVLRSENGAADAR